MQLIADSRQGLLDKTKAEKIEHERSYLPLGESYAFFVAKKVEMRC